MGFCFGHSSVDVNSSGGGGSEQIASKMPDGSYDVSILACYR